MTFVEKLNYSIYGATNCRLHYESVERLNEIADNIDYPAAFVYLVGNGGLSSEIGTLKERLQIAVFFVDLTEFDFESNDNEQIIEKCKEKAFLWLKSLSTDQYWRLVSINSTERVYDMFDVNLTGYAVNVTIEELQGSCVE